MNTTVLLVAIFSFFSAACGFVLPSNACSGKQPVTNTNSIQVRQQSKLGLPYPLALEKERKSMANVQMMGFFGLGAPEIVLILVAGAFVLGPQKLAALGKEAGKMSSDFKDVPKEFQKGFEEGEIEAKSRVAKKMDSVEE